MSDDLFDDGFRAEMSDVSIELKRIGELADGVARAMSRAFRGAILDGKSFQSVLGDIAGSLADIALRAALKPLEGLVGGFIETLFTATNPALGGVTPFAGATAVAAPAFLPARAALDTPAATLAAPAGLAALAYAPMAAMAGGIGAGDAAPAAPLAGGLNPAAAGAGPVNVTFNVTASDARSFATSEAEVSAMLLRAVRRGTRGN
ncbi:MAG: hypothetical protein KIT02_00195 [Devosia sp.]|uniref:hypothetical protein n=1 Tax=Devosia sp. TaxID=1871048 RepID=UPI0024C68924|nr:hypothetical protein [Devosia sp.]UYN99704.1 MAG: hypothetical protein KIT02_00195 [Devosia sp.]